MTWTQNQMIWVKSITSFYFKNNPFIPILSIKLKLFEKMDQQYNFVTRSLGPVSTTIWTQRKQQRQSPVWGCLQLTASHLLWCSMKKTPCFLTLPMYPQSMTVITFDSCSSRPVQARHFLNQNTSSHFANEFWFCLKSPSVVLFDCTNRQELKCPVLLSSPICFYDLSLINQFRLETGTKGDLSNVDLTNLMWSQLWVGVTCMAAN